VALLNLFNPIFSCSGGKFSLTKMQVVALFQDSHVEVLSAMVANMVYIIDALARCNLDFTIPGSGSENFSSRIPDPGFYMVGQLHNDNKTRNLKIL
jgi:hypothetical protein